MLKPPNKGGTERPTTPTTKPPYGSHYQTRAATQAATNSKTAVQQNAEAGIPPKGMQAATGKLAEVNKEALGSSSKQLSTPLQIIASAINQLLIKERVDKPVKITLERILRFIKVKEEKGAKRAEIYAMQSEVSTLQKELKQDLAKLQDALATQIENVWVTTNSVLKNTAKTLTDTNDLKEITKVITNKVGKVNDATDKIATTTQSYRDVLLQNPVATGKHNLDPKVLGDMERKARQILVNIFDEDDSKSLGKSITEVIAKANNSLGKITDAEKLAKVQVKSALRT